MTRARVAVSAIVCAAIVLSGCAGDSTGVPEPDPQPARHVIFDMGHGEIFGADDSGDLGQSIAVERIQAAGYDVRVSTAPLTSALLEEASGLVLAGPMRALSVEEADAVEAYVRDGGTVLITIHVPFPVMSLPARFGLPITDGIVQSTDPLSPSDAGVFVTEAFSDDPLVQGVEGILVLSGWGMSASSADATVVVSSGPASWVDADGDGVATGADPVGPFGIVGVARVGAGTVVIVSDDGVFANVGIVERDNARLLDNIVRLMEESGRST